MGRSPTGLKRGPWTAEEDQKLMAYIQKHGHGSWLSLPDKAGLQRCGKSCRLRWINYLRPDIKRGKFSLHEQNTIIQLHALLGNRWSAIASYLPKRTDNEIKNYWNTRIKKRLAMMGIDPSTHRPMVSPVDSGNGGDSRKVSNLTHMAQWESARLEAEARLVKESSKLHQNKQPVSGLQLRLPTQRFDKPRCLDILKAWQILQLDGVDNARDSSIDITYFNSNEGLFTECFDMEFGGNENNNNDEDMIKGFSKLFFDSCESDNLVHMNIETYLNNGNNDDENNNYWDDMFNFVDCEP